MTFKNIAILILLTSCGFRIVDTGNKGIEKRFGKIQNEPLDPGLHFYNPFTSGVVQFNIQEHQFSGKGACNTRDTQVVDVSYTATFRADGSKVFDIYTQYGIDWVESMSLAAIIEAQIKIAIGKIDAADLVKNQDAAVKVSFDLVKSALAEKNVNLGTLSFKNIDFSKEFEKAVEDKVVAEQSAMQAKNKTVEVEEKAKQTVLSAEAEAKAMQIKSKALAENKGLIQFEAVQRWDGKLPVNLYGSAPIPFITLEGKK